jgi:mannonate dehydratase
MKVILGQGARPHEEYLDFARQLGLEGVQFNTPDLPGDARWELDDLIGLRRACEERGLGLEAIENLPNSFYERAMLGLPGRDEEIENVCATITNLGRAGVPVLGYNFMPTSVWRTALASVGRGGAVVTEFDLTVAENPEFADRVLIARRDQRVEDAKDSWQRGAYLVDGARATDEDMWDNYLYFARAVLPVAEAAGVRLALHPDDPPVPSLGGVARIFRSVDALKRASEALPSSAWALQLCLGTVSEMGGEPAVLEAIEYFGPRDQIAYVHFRDVIGTVPSFRETFLGEGNFDPVRVIETLVRCGFAGCLLDDHTPALIGDSAYGHRGRAHAIGFLQGILATIQADHNPPAAAP